MTSSPFAAPTVGAKTARTSDEMTSAAGAGTRRATLLSKVSLLDFQRDGRLTSADESAKPAETIQPPYDSGLIRKPQPALDTLLGDVVVDTRRLVVGGVVGGRSEPA